MVRVKDWDSMRDAWPKERIDGIPQFWEAINASRAHLLEFRQRINTAKLFNAHYCLSPIAPGPMSTQQPGLKRTAVLTVAAHSVGKVIRVHDNIGLMDASTAEKRARLENPYLGTTNNSEIPSVRFAILGALVGDMMISNASQAVVRGMTEPKFRRATYKDIERLDTCLERWFSEYLRETFTDNASSQEQQRMVVGEEDEDDTTDDVELTCVFAWTPSNDESVTVEKDLIELVAGHVGRAGNVRAGDDVMVFLGARTPFIDTPLGDMEIEGIGKQMGRSIVEDTCIIGVMDGEFVEQCRKEKKMTELIYLI